MNQNSYSYRFKNCFSQQLVFEHSREMLDPLKLLSGLSIQLLIFCVYCGGVHGWGAYNYSEAIVYTSTLNETVQNPGGNWTDYCNLQYHDCFTFYCDDNQYLDEHGKCANIGSYIPWGLPPEVGLIYFHDDSPNYTITTKSQEYFKELKTRVNRNDSSVYFRNLTDDEASDYQFYFVRFMIAPYTYESNQGQIFALKNRLDIVMLMDYRCSLMYVKLYYIDLFKIFNEIGWIDHYAIVTVSIISLVLVVIFYIFIRGLRNNIIGKSTLMLVIINCCFYINYKVGLHSKNMFVYFLKNYLLLLNDPWLLFIVWDTFRFIRYVLY
jgi:hypothetical protein